MIASVMADMSAYVVAFKALVLLLVRQRHPT